MKALSLTQPWASLVVLGKKRIETRGWHTAHRGLLAIHAARKFPADARALCLREPFRSALAAAGIDHPDRLPRGVVLGTVYLRDCVRTDDCDEGCLDLERAFGDFSPGRWAWLLEQPSALALPVPARGQLGIFELPEEVFRS